MARMTKKEMEALQEARRTAAFWSAWNAALDEEHGSSGVMYLDDIVPDTPPPEVSPFDGDRPSSPFDGDRPEGFGAAVRESLRLERLLSPFRAPVLNEGVDAVLGVGAGLTDIGGVLVDTVAPDAHPLSMGEEGYADGMTPGLYARSAAQNIADTALRLPSAAMGIAEWLGVDSHGALMPLAAADARLTPVADERGRRAEAIDAQRRAAGLPDSQELRESVPLNRLADALYGGAEAVRGAQSAELKAAQQGLGEAVQGGVGDTARFLASGPGMRALLTGVLPESAAYAAPQMATARLARLGGAGTGLSQTAANMGTAYTVAQQNARDVEGQILGLSPEEAMAVPAIAAEFANTGDIDSAKRIVANRARHETLAASVPAAPLYALDTFSRIGAGVRSGRTATLQRQVGYGVLRESAGEFSQEASEAIAADLGLARAGLIDRDEVGATAPAVGMLGALASAPIAGGASYAQARAEFSDRADRRQADVARLRALEELMRADRPVSDSVVTEPASGSEDEGFIGPQRRDVSRADYGAAPIIDNAPMRPSELNTVEENAANEAANLALSGISAATLPTTPLSATRELSAEEQEIVNQRLLDMTVDPDEQDAWSLLRSVPTGRDLDAKQLRDERGRLTSERYGDHLNSRARDERGRMIGGTNRDRLRPRTPSVEELTADAQRQADILVGQQQEEAAAADARQDREAELAAAREFDKQEQEKGDAAARQRLANAKGDRTRRRRAHLAGVREANLHLDADARAEVLADAMVEWDAANPVPTLETLPPETTRGAPRGARQSRQAPPPNVYGRAPRPGARPAPEAAPEASVEPTEEVDPAVQAERASALEELRARYRREQRGTGEPAGKKASEVVQELADRVRRGTNRRALEVDALLTDGKLTIVDPEIMATVDGATSSTEGYYDGERMYINAAALPEGDPVGVLLDSVLAHEANHAATMSQNPDAVSKARMLLEDAPRRKLIEQLETANHPTAIAAREAVAVASRGIDKAADPARYEDELVAYAINHAIESGGRSWAPIRGLVSAARAKFKEFVGSDNLNLNDLAHYANATINALAESDADITAPGVQDREQIAMHGTPATFAPEEGAPLGRMRSDRALTGEGAQAYGAGHYLTQQWDTAENRYRTRLSKDRSAQPSRERALAEAIESSRWAVENPSDLAAEDVVDRLRYLDQHWTSERSRMQSVVENSADELDRGYYESRVAEIGEDLAAIRSALELAENSDLRQMLEMVDDTRDADVGEVYYADIPEDSEMMHWQEPVSARSQEMQNALLSIDPDANLDQPFASWYIQRSQSKGLGRSAGDRAVSDELVAEGIKGHIFSGRMDGERNFVVYSDDDVDVGGRDRRELGETRSEMEAFGEEIQSRPDSSRSRRQQFEEDARQRVQEERAARPATELALEPFEGRAQEAAKASSNKPHVANIPSPLATLAKDAFTVYGSIGENLGRLMQEANYSRDAIYQTAIHNYHRVGPAMEAAADKALAGEQGSVQEKREKFNDMILDRMSKIAELPTENAKDKALARLVQQYPDLAPLVRAVHDINKMTDTIIESRFAYDTTSPLTNEEIDMYSYMYKNKYGYLTNIYAAFQGKDGKKYTEAVMNAGAVGMKALAEGKEVPPKLKRLYQVYDDALRFIMQSDVAVSDPEMLAAMDIGDVTALYDRWMPARMRAADVAQEFRNHNNGVLDTHSFKAFLEEEIAAYVGMLKDPDYRAEDGSTGSEILHKQANAVMRSLLEGGSVPGPAARYAKPRGIDTTILEHRAKLPDAIANLYGQIRDVPSLINATLTRQGELASRLDFFNKLATEGYGDAVVNAADRHLRGNENFTQLLSGPSFGRLNGMYTTPEMAKRLADYGSMFTDLVDTIAVAGVNPTLARRWMAHKLGEVWTTGAGLQKAMKIITRPDYHLLNLAGSFSAPVLAGFVKPAHLLTGMKVALEHVALQIDPKGRVIGPELSAAHQLALQTGAFDNAVTQELRRAPRKLVNRLLDEMTAVDTVGGMMSLLKKAATWSNDRGWQTLVEAYTMMDTWVKLPILLERMDYLESYYKANGDTVSREELTRQAARYMRDATISMDNVPGLAKVVERIGMTFYLPYFASVFRVLHKSNMHIVDSIKMAANAKTPEAKNIAIWDAGRKMAGVGAVWTTALWGLKYVTEMGMSDDDREQMERDRALMYDEGKYGVLRYVGTNDEGHRQYILASRTDQFGPAFDLVRTLQEADSVEEGLTQLASGTWDLLVANRLFGATLEHVARGGKNTQLERTFPRATTWFKNQAQAIGGKTGREIMDYLITVGDLSSPAGVVNYFDPRNKTPEEVEGNAAAIISSMAAVSGHTLLTVNPEVAIRGKARELKEHRKDANSRIRESIQNLGPKAGFEAFVREAKKERALTEEMADMYYSRLDSGMSRQEVEEWMELDAVTIRNIRNMAFTSENDRWIKEWSGLLSDQSINNPPEFRDMPPEDAAAAQEEWRAQAFEVNKMINAMNIKEKR